VVKPISFEEMPKVLTTMNTKLEAND